MMYNVANNAKSHLTSSIGPSDTTLTVAGGSFPNPPFLITLFVSKDDDSELEIIRVNKKEGTVFSELERGYEGTTPRAWGAGTQVENRWTAGTYNKIIQALSQKVDSSRVLTDVPADAVFTDTIYVHPPTHPASMIVENSDRQFVTSAEKAKLASIEAGAQKNTVLSVAGKTGHVSLSLSDIAIDRDLLPVVDGAVNLGAPNKKFNRIYAKEIHIDGNTLYIGDTPVLGTDADNIMVKADPHQSIAIMTKGTGKTSLTSQSGVELYAEGLNSDIKINATGDGGKILLGARQEINLVSPEVILTGGLTVRETLSVKNLNVAGNVFVSGEQFVVDAEVLQVKDNIIEINKGERGYGVTAGRAGLKVDRGDAPAYFMVFDESTQTFSVGMDGDLEIIATREYVDERITTALPTKISLENVTETAELKIMTAAERAKLAAIEEGANKYILPAATKFSLGGVIVGDRLNIDSNGVLSAAVQTTNDFTDALKQKLEGIEEGANNYKHPATHPASMITTDSQRRFVSDAQIAAWNAKWDFNENTIKQIKVNAAVTADTIPWSGIADKPSVYPPATHTHPVATSTSAGFMSAADKAKLDSINEDDIGGIKDIPIASATVLGGIKVGNRLSITSDGVLSAAIQTEQNFTTAYKNKLDGIEAGANNYVHPNDGGGSVSNLTGSKVISGITVNTLGHVTGITTRDLKASDIGAWVYDEATIKAVKVNRATVADSADSVAWANVTDKPAQATRWPSWSEVTGKPSTFTPTTNSVNGLDMDNVTSTGFYQGYTMTNSASKTISTFLVIRYSEDWISQTQIIPASNPAMYIRARHSGTTWSPWYKVWHDGNFDPTSKANASHNHSASDITSGTISTARLPSASTSAAGIVQLSSATNSTSTTLAATASAVKAAYDLAASKWTYNESTIKAVKVNRATVADSADSVAWANVSGKPSTFTPSSHTHGAGDISSGTLGVARGGTGRSSLTSGKVLVGNGTSAVLIPTNLHWDNTNSRLGINTVAPTEALDVAGVVKSNGLKINSLTIDSMGNITLPRDRYKASTPGLDANNSDIVNVNSLSFKDPGPDEGIIWDGGSGWRIVECPDDITTNSGGNLQFAQGIMRRMTVRTDGKVDIPGGVMVGDFEVVYDSGSKSLNFNFIG